MHIFAKGALLLALTSIHFVEAAEVFPITQFTFDNESPFISVASDDMDTGVAVLADDDVIYGTYSSNRSPWTALVALSPLVGNTVGAPKIAMDDSSTAIAVWVRNETGVNHFIDVVKFSNGVWTPFTPLETTLPADPLCCAWVDMDGSGKALAGWTNLGLNETHVSFYNGTSWSGFQNLGTSTGGNRTALSISGKAAATWVDGSNLYASYFNGTTWTGPSLLDANADQAANLGIDAAGNAIAIWKADGNTNYKVSRNNGTGWSTPLTLLSGILSFHTPKIAVRLDGTAVAFMIGTGDVLYASFFDGTTWSPTAVLGTDVASVNTAVDNKGDIFVATTNSFKQLYASLMLNGTTTLVDQTFVTSFPCSLSSEDLDLSGGSTLGFLVWNQFCGDDTGDTFGTLVAFGPTSPSDLVGVTCGIRGIDRVNILHWTPSSDVTVVAYNIYRDGVLIGMVPAAGPLFFYDHGRCKGVTNTYAVTAVNAEGIESLPITIVL